jgi:hemerythrin-like domain-containing protein
MPPPPTDVVDLLAEEHAELRKFFEEVEASPSELSGVRYGSLRAQLIRHEMAEEMVLIPYMRRLGGHDEMLEECLAGQAEVEKQVGLIERLEAGSGAFLGAVRDLRALALRHMEVEETGLFAILAQASSEDKVSLAERLSAAKLRAPSRVHPHLPESTPQIVQPIASLVDSIRDLAAGQ